MHVGEEMLLFLKYLIGPAESAVKSGAALLNSIYIGREGAFRT